MDKHHKKCSEKGKLPTHRHHGPYNQVKFGKHDEKEAVKDYTTLRRHLKHPKAKHILTHIIRQEREHKKEFDEIGRLECQIKRKK